MKVAVIGSRNLLIGIKDMSMYIPPGTIEIDPAVQEVLIPAQKNMQYLTALQLLNFYRNTIKKAHR